MSSPQPSSTSGLFQAMPRLNTPLVNADGTITVPWYRLFISMWQRTGGSTVPATSQVLYSNAAGGQEVVLSAPASPITYQAPSAGSLVASSGKVEVSRTGTFRQVSLVGGAIWLATGDSVQVSWMGNEPPTVVFLPA